MPRLPEGNRDQGEGCAIQRTLRLLGNKWSIRLLIELSRGTKRFGELQAALPGLSTKVQTQALKRLERTRLVTRKVFPSIPPRVDYSLTAIGRRLAPILHSLDAWSRDLEDGDPVAARRDQRSR